MTERLQKGIMRTGRASVSAPARKMVSLLKRYSKKRGTAGEGDKKAYLTAGCEDQMRSCLVKALECLLSVIKMCSIVITGFIKQLIPRRE